MEWHRNNWTSIFFAVFFVCCIKDISCRPKCSIGYLDKRKLCNQHIKTRKKKICKKTCKPPIVITSLPVCIRKSGSYCFDRDHCFVPDANNEVAIMVAVDGVEIDFKNKSLQIAGSNTRAIAVHNKMGLTVKNGTIKGSQITSDTVGPQANFQVGIFAEQATHTRIKNMIFQMLGAGVTVTKTHDVVVKNSFFKDGVTGIQAAAWGFGCNPQIVGHVDGVTIEGCHIKDQSQYGIFLRANIRNVRIRNCIIDSCAQEGIIVPQDFFLAENIIIEQTRLSNTGGNGILGQPLCRNWLIRKCQCIRNGRNGIALFGPRNLEITECEVFDSQLSGIFIGVRAANSVAIRSSYINNAGEIPLRLDNVTNSSIEDTLVATYLPSVMPTVRLVDVIGCIIRGCTITNLGSNSAANGLLIRGSTGVQCENVVIDSSFLPNSSSERNQSNAIVLDGGNKNCVIRLCTLTSAARGIAVLQNTQFNGVNTGIIIDRCSISTMQESGIFVDNVPGVTILDSEISQCGTLGIELSATTLTSSIRGNTVHANGVGGIRDGLLGNNAIFHNFGSQNSNDPENNFINVDPALVVAPAPNVGVLENISQ